MTGHVARPTLFGHPTSLFTLFFAEMWERFSYYGMRALLVFYMMKGFLGYNDSDAYKVYGAYTALVYMTPFFGGVLADRLLGRRRAVVFGGLLMAAGHLLMTLEVTWAFYGALALLIAGNGFFKPNISTIVGEQYEGDTDNKDAGFTIFYMGINLGAALAPLVCGYVGETYGWHYGFGLATFGMIIGLAVFVAPTIVTQVLILGGALATGVALLFFQDTIFQLLINGAVAVALVVAGVVAFRALSIAGLPADAGAPPDAEALRRPVLGPLTLEHTVYLGTLAVVPVVGFLVASTLSVRLISPEMVTSIESAGPSIGAMLGSNAVGVGIASIMGAFLGEMSTLPGLLLMGTGVVAFGYLFLESVRSEKVARERLWVALILMFFSMLFWAFFEQAGSSINNFTDRNIDRVFETSHVTQADVGKTLEIALTQEQLGYAYEGAPLTLTRLDDLRSAAQEKGTTAVVSWPVTPEHVGMGYGGPEVPASTFQAANPMFILSFGLGFTALWSFLAARRIEPSTPVKFSLGLLQLGLGFGVLWYGAEMADSRGMVGMSWLVLGYLLHTTGELCLSPVGLSMITKLTADKLVSTAMGAWFLATAFSQLLGSVIALFTSVGHGGGGDGTVPLPIDTVHVYGSVFGQIGIVSLGAAVVAFAISPLLRRWMHEDSLPHAGGGGH